MSDIRKKIIAGNWKMNLPPFQGNQLVQSVLERIKDTRTEVIFIPPFTHLSHLSTLLKDRNNFFLGAQNCHQLTSGAYTGEISASMLNDLGIKFVVLGHSERRQYFGENDKLINKKLQAVLGQSMKVIYCCGESEEDRSSGRHKDRVEQQMSAALSEINESQLSEIVIAYEPVWAIGTGKTASPEQAEDMHYFIRTLILNRYSAKASDRMQILYGGSVKGSNARDLLKRPGIDGALVGGASLDAEEFCKIIEATG